MRAGRRATVWTNWAGQQRCAPAVVERPRGEEELADAIGAAAAAGHEIRAVGSGHSFTDIACTDGCMVSLEAMDRVLDADPATGLMRVQAGITLHALGRELAVRGLALENQGDIDAQALAGALATATHGTGARFANLSALVVGCRLVTADGTVVALDAERDPDGLRAARVSLGALGVASELTLQTVPAFRIHKIEEPRPLRAVLDALDDLVDGHDHFEVYAFPYSDTALALRSERTDRPPAPLPRWREFLLDDLLENRALEIVLRMGRRFPSAIPHLSRGLAQLARRTQRLDQSHLVYATERRVRFTEMEYAIPRAHAREALERVLALIERRRIPVSFPIELRFAAADDAFLSTACGRDTAYIAVHQFVSMEYESYFRGVEAIMDLYGGRPHWGKRHFQSTATLASRYPDWERFQAVRARLDPSGALTNAYVRRVLGSPVYDPRP